MSWFHSGASSIYATAGEAAFKLLTHTQLNFPGSLTGQSLIALLDVVECYSQTTRQR